MLQILLGKDSPCSKINKVNIHLSQSLHYSRFDVKMASNLWRPLRRVSSRYQLTAALRTNILCKIHKIDPKKLEGSKRCRVEWHLGGIMGAFLLAMPVFTKQWEQLKLGTTEKYFKHTWKKWVEIHIKHSASRLLCWCSVWFNQKSWRDIVTGFSLKCT